VLTPLARRYRPTSEYTATKNAAVKADMSPNPKDRKPFPALAIRKIPSIATITLNPSLLVVRSLIMIGDKTASITGLVFTKKVAFATVVSLTAKMNVVKCMHRKIPEIMTRIRSRFLSILRLLLHKPNRIIPEAAMERRKNVSARGETSVANLMKSAVDPNESEAKRSALIPLEGNTERPLAGILVTK